MEPTVSSETSAIRTQTPGNYPKRYKLHLEQGESLKTRMYICSLEEGRVFGYRDRTNFQLNLHMTLDLEVRFPHTVGQIVNSLFFATRAGLVIFVV